MTAARIRAQFPTSDGFGYQLKGCCRPPFVWASYNISRYIGRHSSRENNVPYCSHYSSSNVVAVSQAPSPESNPNSLCQDWVIYAPAALILSPDKPIPGSAEGVNEKRQLSPGLSPTSPIKRRRSLVRSSSEPVVQRTGKGPS